MTEQQTNEQNKKIPVASRITIFSNGNVVAFDKAGSDIPFLGGNVFENLLLSMKQDGVLTDDTVIECIHMMPDNVVASKLAEKVKQFTGQKMSTPEQND